MNPLGAQLIVSQRMLAFSNAWVVQHSLYLLSIMHYIAQAGQELGSKLIVQHMASIQASGQGSLGCLFERSLG